MNKMTDYSNLVHRLRTEWYDVETDCEAADAIEAQAKRIAELEVALQPFADEADEYEGLGVQDKDQIFVPFAACRQARKVLGDKSD